MAAHRRWTFTNPTKGETYTFRINPDQMSSPHAPRNIETATTTAGAPIAFEGPEQPHQWQFSGVCLSADQHEELLAWTRHKEMILLTDHFGRGFYGYFAGFEFEHGRRRTRYWYGRYTIRFVTMMGPTPPTEMDVWT